MSAIYQPLRNVAPTYPSYPSSDPQPLPGLQPVWPQTSYPPFYIPVAGPKPYNSLIFVTTVVGQSGGSGPADSGYSFDLQTNFVFPGYDFRNAKEIAYRHSTVVWIDELQQSEQFAFSFDQTQVDTAFFSATGAWTVRCNYFSSIGTLAAPGEVEWRWRLASWILCYLPPAANLAPP